MKKLYMFLFCTTVFFAAKANNIQVSNISVSQPNITFTISWDNSWNTMSNINPLYPNNWDGAWVFVKYQNNIDNLWKHATVSSVASDHTISGSVLQIDPASDGMGVFIRRINTGNGSVSATVTLKMNALVGTGNFNFKVFGTEVVYIPQSNFQLGDGQVSGALFFTPQNITSATQSAGIGASGLYTASPALPAAFPMGYNGFYMMKYEITYEQWVDFLNTLTYDQQANRVDAVPNSPVNSQAYTTNTTLYIGDNIIKMQAAGLNNTLPAVYGCDLSANNIYNETADGQNVAMTSMSKADFYGYLDWCALRPMTELEFEKSCRGTQARVLGEYAWGTTDLNPRNRLNMSSPGTNAEAWTGAIVNGQVIAQSGPNGSLGPVRVGQFGTGSSGRLSSGAGFYGNMDLTGNAWEMCVMADATGVVFTGNNGNGALTTAGDADVTGWPAGAAAGGTILKGGSFYETSNYNSYTEVSYRIGAAAVGRTVNYGGRGVRTAP